MNGALTYGEYRSQRYFPVLDGIRAVSILLVFYSHVESRLPAGHKWAAWTSGFLGVYSFFVLSGFLITTLALREEDARGSLSLKRFYLRRIFRIFPLYYFVLALYAVLSFALRDQRHIQELIAGLPYFLTYMNEFSPVAMFAQGWSLGIEEKFYLAWPLLGFVLWRKQPRERLTGTVILIAVPLAVSMFVVSRPHGGVGVFLLGYSMIMVGCLLAQCLHSEAIFGSLQFLTRLPWIMAALVLVLTVHRAIGVFPARTSPVAMTLAFAYSASVALLMVSLLLVKSPLAAVLSSRPLRFVGSRSYAMYLIHMLVVNAVIQAIPPVGGRVVTSILWAAACLAVTLVVSDGMHRFMEIPMISLGRRLISANGSVSPRYPESKCTE